MRRSSQSALAALCARAASLVVFLVFAALGVSAQTTCALTGTLSGDAAGACICPSGYKNTGSCTDLSAPASGTCSGAQNITNTALWAPAVAVSTGLSNSTFATYDQESGNNKNMKINVNMPWVQGRQYTRVSLTGTQYGAIPSSCDAVAAIATFELPGGAYVNNGCYDIWQLGISFQYWVEKCGLARSAVNDASTGYETYDGNLHVEYTEPITLGTGGFTQSVTRTGIADVPIRIALQSRYTVAMNVTNTKVFTNLTVVDFAVQASNIPLNSTTPNVTVVFASQYPYTINSWTSVQKVGSGGSNIGSSSSVILVGTTPGNQMGSGIVPTQGVCNGAAGTDYKTGQNMGAQGTCTKSEVLTFTNANSGLNTCQFIGDTYQLSYTIYCASNINAQDCPLLSTTGTTGSLQFTLSSNAFCQNSAVTQNINNVVQLVNFRAINPNATSNWANTVEQRSWMWNDWMWMQIKMTGIPLTRCYMTKLEVAYLDNQSAQLGATPTYQTRAEAGVPGAGTVANNVPSNGCFFDQGTVKSAYQSRCGNGNANGNNFIDVAGFANTNLGLVDPSGAAVNSATAGPGGSTAGGQEYRFAVLLSNTALLSSPVSSVTGPPARGSTAFLRMQATLDVAYTRFRRRRSRQAASDLSSGRGQIESPVNQLLPGDQTAQVQIPDAAAVAPVQSSAPAVFSAATTLMAFGLALASAFIAL